MIFDAEYLEYLSLFAQHRFFECHEVLEKAWLRDRKNDYYKGLIQVAACLHLMKNLRFRGAKSLIESARAYLKRFGPHHLGLNVSRLVRDLDRLEEILNEGPRGLNEELFPVIEFDETRIGTNGTRMDTNKKE